MLRLRYRRILRNIGISCFAVFLMYKVAVTIHGLLLSLRHLKTDDILPVDHVIRSRELHGQNPLLLDSEPISSTAKHTEIFTGNGIKSILQPLELYTKDIMRIPQIQFLEEYRSPCFYEQRTGLVSRKGTVERALTMGGGKYMRCIPYFMLAGFPKSGTTDMYQRLTKHKFIGSSFDKEPLWWSIHRYEDPSSTLASYMDNFIPAIQKAITRTGECDRTDRSSCHPLLIGDFSTRELLQERETYTENRNTWQLISHLNPKMKFIVVMRDPVERLFSDFVYFSTVGNTGRISPQHFHEEVVRQMAWWGSCTKRYTERRCMYGQDYDNLPPLRVMHNTCWKEAFDGSVCAAFRIGLYYNYISDWLETFPREQFLFINTERYSESLIDVINNDILQFLNLEPFVGQEEALVKNMPRQYPLKRNAKQTFQNIHSVNNKMLPETRAMLEAFYRPYNEKLARFIGDVNYLWYDKPHT